MRFLLSRFKYFLILWLAILSISSANAQNEAVYKITSDKAMNDVYDKVYASLEEAKFFVVFEPNIGKNIAGFAERWGDEYNQNNLTAIRSMVFCNGWYANQVSNKDPDMLGMCPLRLTLYEKNGVATVLFNRPSAFSANSPAHSLFEEIEIKVINAIKKGMQD